MDILKHTELSDWQFFIRYLLFPILSLLLSGLIGGAAWYGALKPNEIEVADWFSRGGALITSFALLANVRLSKAKEFFDFGARGYTRANELGRSFSRVATWLNYLSTTVTIIGSLIWGYGDLFHS